MFGLENIRDFIKGLDQKEMARNQYIYIGCFTLLVSFLIFRHIDLRNKYDKKMNALSQSRKTIQKVLTEYGNVKNQKIEVDALLKKDKSFYIQKYFQDVVKSLQITRQSTASLVSQTLPNGYIEESLQINLAQINMKQLCDLLQKIETTSRVYAKSLDISKGTINKTMSVSMVIATLKPKAEGADSA